MKPVPFLQSQSCPLQVGSLDQGPKHMNGVQFHNRLCPLVWQTKCYPLELHSESRPAEVHTLQNPAGSPTTWSRNCIMHFSRFRINSCKFHFHGLVALDCNLLLEVWWSLPTSPCRPAAMKWGRTSRHPLVLQLQPTDQVWYAGAGCIWMQMTCMWYKFQTIDNVLSRS